MRMAADRFDACPLNVQNALRARLITVFFGAVFECAKKITIFKNFQRDPTLVL